MAGRASRGLLWCRAVENILAQALGQDASQLAAAEKRDLLARLLGRLAHEVRNPLSSLDIHFQLLEEDLASLAPQIREQLTSRMEIIHGELHRLEGIVERFLRLAGPSGVDLEPVEIGKILNHVCELLRHANGRLAAAGDGGPRAADASLSEPGDQRDSGCREERAGGGERRCDRRAGVRGRER